jgi:hypothetical protein
MNPVFFSTLDVMTDSVHEVEPLAALVLTLFQILIVK